MDQITIKGARLHNLKNIDVSIPKNKLVVATGVSGSGKSSLVFDIVFEEGRRQYLQSLGVLANIEDEDKFDKISGIAPTIAVQQNIIRQSNPRSTVGSRTQILNLLSLLFAAEGKITCRSCGLPVNAELICETCGSSEERYDATYFSYNAPNGMCLKCSGRGGYYEIDLEKLVPDDEVPLKAVFEKVGITPGYKRILTQQFGDYMEMAFNGLPDEIKSEAIFGHYVTSNSQHRSYCLTRIFEFSIDKFGHDPSGIYRMTECSECNGYRIGEEAQTVFLHGRHIGELGKMTIHAFHTYLCGLTGVDIQSTLGENLRKEIQAKTDRLVKSRLGHLSLYREMSSLSGGEVQRLFLNNHLESNMNSLIFILDEPTVGLHESEKAEIINSIQNLKQAGNTVIVVEHDRKTIEKAEHIIDIGPKAGVEGGRIVYAGDLSGLLEKEDSLTGQYLSGKKQMPERKDNLLAHNAGLTIRNAKTNNLKDVTVFIPLGGLVGVAGVSGSGKSSLISKTLIPLLKSYFYENRKNVGVDVDPINGNGSADEATVIKTIVKNLEGMKQLSGYAEVSQAPIGRNMNSNPVTYIGIWDKIRKIFAEEPKAREQGLSTGHFSFNSKGACESCGGSGQETIRLAGNFNLYSTCRVCKGKRYNEEALSIYYQDKNIYDVLEMTVSEAVVFFADRPEVTATLKVMDRIGMGYIKLGQPTPTLSGGEAQRVKLAREIGRRRKGNTLFILDEPTTGLSLYDTAKLIQLLDELVQQGNSVIVVEHDTEVLSVCDWILELGPGAGVDGGQLISTGTPMDLKQNPHSVTGRYLK